MNEARRKLMQKAGVALPLVFAPTIESVLLPAHAQTSPMITPIDGGDGGTPNPTDNPVDDPPYDDPPDNPPYDDPYEDPCAPPNESFCNDKPKKCPPGQVRVKGHCVTQK